jgi:hypothetical protein
VVKQLHNKFPDEQIKSLLERYLLKEIEINYILEIWGIKRMKAIAALPVKNRFLQKNLPK